ncbi:MAG: hypothetical protein KDD56_01360 [Bdellovibrionales bacterium]|nr:hypothetical protein [Bdellovibrionales bacterium]
MNEDFLDIFSKNDPTWKRAMLVARKILKLNTQSWQLIKSGWLGSSTANDFKKILSFSELNPNCLITASGMNTPEFDKNADTLEHSINFLGSRYSAVILAINYTCNRVIKSKPKSHWKNIFEDMINTIEIGYLLGAKCKEIGLEGGALMGFARAAGLGLLLADNFDTFKKWHSMTGGFENRELQIELFGCEAYQASSFALQVLGFGPEVALGAALGTGKLSPDHVSYPREVLMWRAAFEWIEALKSGKAFPEKRTIKNFFPELVPPTGNEKNLNLEALYSEVANVKRNGCKWVWHLPKSSYEETSKLI